MFEFLLWWMFEAWVLGWSVGSSMVRAGRSRWGGHPVVDQHEGARRHGSALGSKTIRGLRRQVARSSRFFGLWIFCQRFACASWPRVDEVVGTSTAMGGGYLLAGVL